MNIIFWIIWWIILDDPIDVREVESSLRYIRAKENTSLGLGELKVGRGSLLLLLFAVNILDGNINVIEKVTVEFDCVAARHEYHNLLFHIFLQECEQKLEFFRWIFGHNVSLLKISDS